MFIELSFKLYPSQYTLSSGIFYVPNTLYNAESQEYYKLKDIQNEVQDDDQQDACLVCRPRIADERY
jgi:hypothetical protein